jgi:hypothetical protein
MICFSFTMSDEKLNLHFVISATLASSEMLYQIPLHGEKFKCVASLGLACCVKTEKSVITQRRMLLFQRQNTKKGYTRLVTG